MTSELRRGRKRSIRRRRRRHWHLVVGAWRGGRRGVRQRAREEVGGERGGRRRGWAVRSRCESAAAERSGGMRGGLPLGSPRMDGVTTLLPPFVFESTRFGPWAKLRSGASFKTGRPGPFAGLGLSLRVLLVHGHPTRISHGRP